MKCFGCPIEATGKLKILTKTKDDAAFELIDSKITDVKQIKENKKEEKKKK